MPVQLDFRPHLADLRMAPPDCASVSEVAMLEVILYPTRTARKWRFPAQKSRDQLKSLEYLSPSYSQSSLEQPAR